ncbi:InlB B-repeat-containing protein, partial [Candidatus Saccharibacteria bacterium]|nr:InlB B-repeat-containing protein [Candidatus Saccharibacteria bacterium]
FTAAANPPYVGYTLKFNPNIDGAGGSGSGSDIASNMPATMTETVMATSYKFTVPDTIPTRPGYRFIGWSRTAAHTMGTPSAGDTGSGTDNLYVAGDKVEVVAEDMSDLSDVKAEATIYAIWANEYTYTITYNCNSGSGCPSNFSTSEITSTYTYTISSTEPTRSGYNFTGYLGSDSTTYQAGGTVSLSSSKLSVTLTAQWEQSAPAFFTITYMQDMTPSVCASATTPTKSATTSDTTGARDGNTSYVPETTLIDYRGTDGTGTASSPATGSNIRSYTVRKLADGNCWMSENLKLTLTNNQPVLVGTFSGGETSWTPTGDGAGNDYNEAIKANTTVNGRSEWHYPWYAATAGQGTQTENPTISQSICPKGWKLPNGGANTAPSFQSLVDTYGIGTTGSTKLQSAPLSFYYAGRYLSGRQEETSAGYYWSASPYTSDSNRAYNLRFSSNSVDPQRNYDSKSAGESVRCVAIP